MLNIPIRSSSRKKCISPIRMTNTAESLVDMPKMSFEEGDPSNLQNNEESPIVKIPVTPDSTKLQELNEKFAKKTSLNHQISESFENYSNIALMIAQKEENFDEKNQRLKLVRNQNIRFGSGENWTPKWKQ